MSWFLFLLFSVQIAYGKDFGINNEKVQPTNSVKEVINQDILQQIKSQILSLKKEVDSLKTMTQEQTSKLNQSISNVKEELTTGMNQSLDSIKKEILLHQQDKSVNAKKPDTEINDIPADPGITEQMLLLVGGVRQINGRHQRVNDSIALINGTCIRKSSYPEEIEDLTLTQITGKKLIAVGGWTNYGCATSNCYIFHLETNIWENGPLLNSSRYLHCSVIFGSKIYAVGGADKFNSLKTVEVLDSSKGDSAKWEFVSPMGRARIGASAVIYNGELYVTGGIALRSCEKYIFQQDKWHPIPDMSYNRYRHGLVKFNKRIYAIGGLDTNTDTAWKSVESFDGEIWLEESPLNVGRWEAAVGVIGQNIYVIGGNGYVNRWKLIQHMSMEIFDAETSKWRFVNLTGTLPLPISSGFVFVDTLR